MGGKSRLLNARRGTLALLLLLLTQIPAFSQDRQVMTLSAPLNLSGQWRFQTGDNALWAEPGFNDSKWPGIQVPLPWGRQGYSGYSGIAWYRLTVFLPENRGHVPIGVSLGYVDSSYEIYAGGILLGGVGGLPPAPRLEYDRRATFAVPPEAVGTGGKLVLALRVWKNEGTNPRLGGFYQGDSYLGRLDMLARREVTAEIPKLILSLLFLLVGLYHIHLYRSRRELKEYLWYGVLAALNAAPYTFLTSQWKFAISDQYALLKELEYLSAFTAPAVFIQFLWLVLEKPIGKALRIYQWWNVFLAAVVVLTPGLTLNIRLLPVWQIGVVGGTLVSIPLVFRQASRGVSDARTIAYGILLFVAAVLNDVAVDRNLISTPRLIPYGFAVFLFSMAVCLANRFARVYAEVTALRHDLEDRVRQRTQELSLRSKQLSEANKKLEERSHELAEASIAKSQFLANMSHELRTPLNAIIGYSEILLEEAMEEGNEGSVPDLKKIQVAGKHLLGLINDILDLSKIEAGRMDFFLEPFRIDTMLEDMATTFAPVVEKNKNTFEVNCPSDIGSMKADIKRVRQVLLNLLSNACKFTENGLIRLSVSRETVDRADWVLFRVEDSGIGMTQKQIDKLFQAFVQADASITRKYGGTGLGLVISKRFCQMMGGDLTVTSEYGKGSAFQVRLPTEVTDVRPEITPYGEVRAEEIERESDERGIVLVIDDDRAARDLMVRIISKEGFRVVTAWGGEEGLRLARDLQPAVITLDVLMPGLDGWEVLKTLKADPELAAIPVVMVTMEEERTRSITLGASEYMTKPIQRETLMQVLEKYMGKHARN